MYIYIHTHSDYMYICQNIIPQISTGMEASMKFNEANSSVSVPKELHFQAIYWQRDDSLNSQDISEVDYAIE